MKQSSKIRGQIKVDGGIVIGCPRCNEMHGLIISTDAATLADEGPTVEVDCPCGHTWVDPRIPVFLVLQAVRIGERVV